MNDHIVDNPIAWKMSVAIFFELKYEIRKKLVFLKTAISGSEHT